MAAAAAACQSRRTPWGTISYTTSRASTWWGGNGGLLLSDALSCWAETTSMWQLWRLQATTSA